MSEEEVNVTPVIEGSINNDASEAKPQEAGEDSHEPQKPKSDKPPGYHPVKLDGLPEEMRRPLEERFRYMYGQIKHNERTLGEYRQLATSQSQKIEELMSGVGQVVDHLQKEKFDSTESALKQQMIMAQQNGDTASFLEAQDKLIDVRTQKRVMENQKQRPAEAKQQAQQQPLTAMQIAEQAVQNGEMNASDSPIIDIWQNETDDGGRLLRPWAHSSDPRYVNALMEARAVFTNPRFTTIEQKLAEMDRRMDVKKTNGTQTVMGGNLTGPRKSSKITLNPEVQDIADRIAVKTRFGGSKYKTDAERIQAYREQIAKVNSRKGARA